MDAVDEVQVRTSKHCMWGRSELESVSHLQLKVSKSKFMFRVALIGFSEF